MALSKDYYLHHVYNASDFDPRMGSYGKDHISHCLDALREAVMCTSDISVITWKWNDKANKALGHGDILHSCRSFDAIRNWSMENRATVEFDAEVYLEDDLDIPEY